MASRTLPRQDRHPCRAAEYREVAVSNVDVSHHEGDRARVLTEHPIQPVDPPHQSHLAHHSSFPTSLEPH